MSFVELLENAVASGAVPGAAVVVAGPDGVREVAAAGVEEDAVWRYASMTKALASVALLQQIEQGRVTLETEVREVLPEFGDLQVLEGFDGDTPILRAPKSQATLRHLLTHTAGCTYFFANEPMKRWHEVTGEPHALTGLVASLSAPLVNDPGTKWEYGVNTDWVGRVVEATSGQPLNAYLAEHLLGPLQMDGVTFSPTPEQRARMIPVHHRTPDGGTVPGEIDLAPDPEWWAGGHGLHGTAAEYGRFMAALLGGGELDGARILQPETVDLMFSDQLGGAPLPDVIRSSEPALCNDIPALPVPQAWGLGVHLTLIDLPGMRSAGTGDWAGLFNCYYWVDRSAGVAGAFFTQVLPFFDQAVVESAVAFEQAVYAQVGAAA